MGRLLKAVRKNIIFILVNLCIAIIIAVGFVWSFIDAPRCLNGINNQAQISILIQVTTTLVGIVVAVIAISFTTLDSTFIGVSIKDLRKLRARRQYSLRFIIMFPILLSLANMAFFLLQFFHACVALSLSIMLFCLYVCWTEIPLLAKIEDVGITIIKESIVNNTSQEGSLQETQNRAIAYLLISKNLETTYKKLKTNDNNLNLRILRKILDVQETVANEIQYSADKIDCVKTVDALFGNVRDALMLNKEFMNILPDEEWMRFGYIISDLSKHEESRSHLDGFVYNVLSHLDHAEKTKERERILISVLVCIATTSIRASRYDILKSLCRYYTQRVYVFEKGLPSSKVYGLLSLYFYYICVLESAAPIELKERISDEITRGSRSSYELAHSWKSFFPYYLNAPIETISDYFELFKACMRHLEFLILSGEAQIMIMDYPLAFEWFITRIIGSRNTHRIDYNYVFNDEGHNYFYALKKLYRECFDEEKTFQKAKYMDNILEYYGSSKESILWFEIEEGQRHALFEFLNQTMKEGIQREIGDVTSIDDQSLSNNITEMVMADLTEQWGYKAVETDSQTDASIRLIFPKWNAFNLDEALADSVTRIILNRIRGLLRIKEIEVPGVDELIKIIKKNNIKYSTTYVKETLPFFIRDSAKREQYKEETQSIKKIHSRILPTIAFVDENAFSFTVNLERVEICKLGADEIIAMKNEYKRIDGQYVYEGVFVDEEELISFLESTMRRLNIDIKYSVEQLGEEIISFDYNVDRIM